MISRRGAAPLITLAAFIVTLLLLKLTSNRDTWRDTSQAVGYGELVLDDEDLNYNGDEAEPAASPSKFRPKPKIMPPKPTYAPGTPKPNGYNFSRVLVMPRMSSENVDWVAENLPELETAIYIADDPKAELHPPKNKGHEVMIYFTYIIDHYETLPDIMIFMHSHRYSWHNNELLNSDSVEMLRRLSSERVQREGYMNMRCHWNPGCPNWMHPGTLSEDVYKQEETLMAKSWSEIFPLDPIPLILSQPCCAQFAVSRERVQTTPKATFMFYRDWLLRTDLNDYLSGRIWEYLWQVIFAGQDTFCPLQTSCYCDGYGVCFGGEDPFEEFYQFRAHRSDLESELSIWREKAKKIDEANEKGELDEMAELEVPELNKDVQLEEEIRLVQQILDIRLDQALVRGEDPRMRALESNRTWNEGDGF